MCSRMRAHKFGGKCNARDERHVVCKDDRASAVELRAESKVQLKMVRKQTKR